MSDWAPRAAAPMRAMYGDGFQVLWTRWCDAQQALLQAGGDLCRERLAEVRCPTFLLHGGKDPLVPLFHARFLQQGIPGARLHVFPDGRHDVHLYYAEAFNELLVEFLLS